MFLRAIEIESDEERTRYLDEACAADADLRASVETLLKAHGAAGAFLDSPPGVAAATMGLDPPVVFTAPGAVIGRYKILESMGEGGYGTVFMAEQTAPVHRRVALKIIKAGMDTRQASRSRVPTWTASATAPRASRSRPLRLAGSSTRRPASK